MSFKIPFIHASHNDICNVRPNCNCSFSSVYIVLTRQKPYHYDERESERARGERECAAFATHNNQYSVTENGAHEVYHFGMGIEYSD